MRSGWRRWLLVGLVALLPTLLSLVVNLATDLPLPAFTDNPWVVWPALAVLTLVSVVVTVRVTQPDQAVLPVVGRVRLLAASARLPADTTPLIGREAELDELRGYLTAWDQGGPRVAVLTGPAGVGKSALAIHLGHQLANQLGRPPLYADLGGAGVGRRDPGEVLGWFLHALGVADEAIPPGVEERASLYQARLGDHRRLVVLDNAADAQQLHALLPEGRRCWVVITSRARLATLAGAMLLELDVLPEPAAVKVLEALAGPERITTDRKAAGAVARACGGLPLALRIAAARLRGRPAWTVATLAEYLADRRRRLGRLTVEELAVRASFALSYDDLSPVVARTFRLLGLLASPEVTVEVAAVLAGDDPAAAQEALEGLVDAQLLAVVEPGRYRLHDLLWLFAQELAAAEPPEEQRAAVERALGWLAARVAEADRMLGGWSTSPDHGEASDPAVRAFPNRAAALVWLVAEHTNVVAAVHLAFEQGMYPQAGQLASGLVRFFQFRGFWPQWQDTQSVALQAARAAGNRRAEARALYGLGRVNSELRGFDQAIDHYKQALAICQELGDRYGTGTALHGLGRAYGGLRRFDQAVDHYQQSLAIWRALGDRYGEGATLHDLGMVYLGARRFDQATKQFQQALAIHREVGDRHSEAGTLNNLGLLDRDLRQFDQAIEHFQQALAVRQQLGERREEGRLAAVLGELYDEQHRPDKAMLLYEQALATFEQLGDRLQQGVVLGRMCDLERRRRQRGKAISFHQRSLAIFEQLGDRHRQDWALMTLADLYREQGRLDLASACNEQRLMLQQDPGETPEAGPASQAHQ